MTTESEVVGEKLCKLSTIPTEVLLKKCAAMCRGGRLNCAQNFPRAKNENNYDLSTAQMYFFAVCFEALFKMLYKRSNETFFMFGRRKKSLRQKKK